MSEKNAENQTEIEENFVKYFKKVSLNVYNIAVSKGWWDGQRTVPEFIALCHSELSEALDGERHGDPPDSKVPNFSSVEVELADTIIRIMDMAHGKGYRVAEALIEKIKYNKTRSFKHGGKKF